MKIDPYNNEKSYLDWKEKTKHGIAEISDYNATILLQYLNDMEIGINVGIGTKKGARSFIRLKSLKDKLIFLMKKVKILYNLDEITEISEKQIHILFSKMLNGEIVKANGKKYIAVRDYIKIFKAFWHWRMKVNKKQGKEIQDITSDLDCQQSKPDWVYLDEEQIKKLAENATSKYRALIWFLFDSGIRSPTELINIKVSDFSKDFKELNIRDEISKTFGRRIKLIISSSVIRDYVKNKNISKDDYVFPIVPCVANRYLKRLGKKMFGDSESLAGQKYSELTMYDFRHCSCCYWLPRYKSESALKYRFGWKQSDKIHYYSELLGMRDTISEEDILVDVTKTEIEKEMQRTRGENEVLQEQVRDMQLQMARVMEWTRKAGMELA